MTSNEIREQIIQTVHQVKDENLLLQIFRILELDSLTPEYVLKAEEQLAVEEALKDYTHGRVYNSMEAESLLKEWRKKYSGLLVHLLIGNRFMAIGPHIVQNGI